MRKHKSHKHKHQLTLWSRFLLDQRLEKFPALYGTGKFIDAFSQVTITKYLSEPQEFSRQHFTVFL